MSGSDPVAAALEPKCLAKSAHRLGAACPFQTSDEHTDDVEDHDGGRAADEPTHRERREIGGYPARASLGWAPRYAYSASHDHLEAQIAAIERAAADADHPLPPHELLLRSRSRHWGPGVSRRALREAMREGRIERRNGGYVAARAASRL
jgi:hypothetical protein